MPAPDTAESSSGVFRAAFFKTLTAFRERCIVERVDLRQRDDFLLLVDAVAIGLQLAAHRLVVARNIVRSCIDEVQQNPAAFDMSEEAIAESGTLVCTFDQARNIRQHEIDIAGPHDPEIRDATS